MTVEGVEVLLKRRIFEILFVLTAISVYAWVLQPSTHTWLSLESGQGEYIGQGKAWRFSPENAKFKASYAHGNAEGGVHIRVDGPKNDYFELEFAAPHSQRLLPGHYANAARFAFHPAGQPGMAVSGCGRGNNRLKGSFEVLEISYGESGPNRLAIDFIQFGEENTSHPLKGSIRYHSSVR